MTIEVPAELEMALKMQANARGVSPAVYVREVLERDLDHHVDTSSELAAFKTDYGSLAKYGPAPTDGEMAENRAEMWRNFGEGS